MDSDVVVAVSEFEYGTGELCGKVCSSRFIVMLHRADLMTVCADYPNHQQWQDVFRSSARCLPSLRSIRPESVLLTLPNDDIGTDVPRYSLAQASLRDSFSSLHRLNTALSASNGLSSEVRLTTRRI